MMMVTNMTRGRDDSIPAYGVKRVGGSISGIGWADETVCSYMNK